MATGDDRPPEDLTGRARIRDAALEEFAAKGVRGATVRGIATRAGVSPALVQHHFGTKDGLRRACDEHVLGYIRREADAARHDDALSDPSYLTEILRTAPRVQRYLARSLVDGSPDAAALFDDLVTVTEHNLGDPPDALSTGYDRALVLAAMRLGVIVLHEHMSRGLGGDVFGTAEATRVGRASVDLLNPALLPAELTEQARAAFAPPTAVRRSSPSEGSS
jgi:AcrR family transcriptional regulator